MVKRDATWRKIHAGELVPGDLVKSLLSFKRPS
jgi:hypothetical protein